MHGGDVRLPWTAAGPDGGSTNASAETLLAKELPVITILVTLAWRATVEDRIAISIEAIVSEVEADVDQLHRKSPPCAL